ncbi:unnamed protein product [Brachionus calyciflorus]|uniref:Uncharacterized protein n=1 Tax=Brachionus calyciflorus TaxID=104777 RepID=A0A814CQZ2_9BILA|nr:unnamed protein product [Brachionus calyciflorus]
MDDHLEECRWKDCVKCGLRIEKLEEVAQLNKCEPTVVILIACPMCPQRFEAIVTSLANLCSKKKAFSSLQKLSSQFETIDSKIEKSNVSSPKKLNANLDLLDDNWQFFGYFDNYDNNDESSLSGSFLDQSFVEIQENEFFSSDNELEGDKNYSKDYLYPRSGISCNEFLCAISAIKLKHNLAENAVSNLKTSVQRVYMASKKN